MAQDDLQRFGVSISVVREALTRLAEQGLLVASPQRGFSVQELSVADLADLTQVHVQIESLAFGQAVQNGDVAWETAVVATHHTLDRTPTMLPDGRFNESWSVAHRAFRQALLAGCGSPRLEAIATALQTPRSSTGGGTGPSWTIMGRTIMRGTSPPSTRGSATTPSPKTPMQALRC